MSVEQIGQPTFFANKDLTPRAVEFPPDDPEFRYSQEAASTGKDGSPSITDIQPGPPGTIDVSVFLANEKTREATHVRVYLPDEPIRNEDVTIETLDKKLVPYVDVPNRSVLGFVNGREDLPGVAGTTRYPAVFAIRKDAA